MALNIYRNTIQGRVSIGEKHKEKGYPIKLDHFTATKPFDPKQNLAPKFPEIIEIWKKKYGTDKPKSIKITLIFDHPDEVFFTDYMDYKGKTCKCHGNGEAAMRIIDDIGTKKQVECNYATCEYRMTKTSKGIVNTCKPTGILTFMLPESPVSGGLWKYTSHGEMTIGKILGALKNIYEIRKTLYGLEVNLKIVMVQVEVKGQTQNVPTVEIELPFSWDALAEGAGTTIGTLLDARAKHMTLGCKPNPKVMKELATSAETLGYDGSMDNVVIEPNIVESDPIDTIIETDDNEFHF